MQKKNSWLGGTLAILAGLASASAYAYIPPIHFQVRKITENRPTFQNAVVNITVFKPAQDSRSGDEALWQETVVYSPKAHWPALPLAIEANPAVLQAAWKSFGLMAPSETELLAHKPEQYRAMENAPRPFYRFNPQLSLKRFPGGVAYASSTEDEGRAIWIERDSFRPISIKGPCPSTASSLPWVKGKASECHLDFDRVGGVQGKGFRPFRLFLKAEDQNLLVFRVDSIKYNTSESPKGSQSAPSTALSDSFDAIFR